MPVFKLNIIPVLPVAATVILPLVAVVVEAAVVVPVIIIVGQAEAATLKLCVPEHPLLSFAEIV